MKIMETKLLIPGVENVSQVTVCERGTRVFVTVELSSDDSCLEFYKEPNNKWNEVKNENVEKFSFMQVLDLTPELDNNGVTVTFEKGKLLFTIPLKQPRFFQVNVKSSESE